MPDVFKAILFIGIDCDKRFILETETELPGNIAVRIVVDPCLFARLE